MLIDLVPGPGAKTFYLSALASELPRSIYALVFIWERLGPSALLGNKRHINMESTKRAQTRQRFVVNPLSLPTATSAHRRRTTSRQTPKTMSMQETALLAWARVPNRA